MEIFMKLLCISLGCDKNLVDSERMLGRLTREGWEITDDEAEADAVLVNTCAFIDSAKEESIGAILDAAKLKENGKCRALIVSGCMAERYKREVLDEIPEVDAVVGTASGRTVSSVIRRVFDGETHIADFEPLAETPEAMAEEESGDRVLTTLGGYSFLKIAEGCDKRCTYCIIPYLRGPYRSVPMPRLLAEAKKLAERDVRELILVAQETTLYGTDLCGRKLLPELLRLLSGVDGIRWIRLQYCYPEELTDSIIDAVAETPHVCHYLDLPIQHASDRILRKMGRRTTLAEITERIRRIRERIPDVCLRTSLISGFPGETEEDHQILLDFVRETRFDRLGVFTYSREEGTPAAEMADQVPAEVAERRRGEIMALQQEIAFAKAREKVGRIYDVLIEGRLTDTDDIVYTGRTYMDAPDVDSQIFVRTNREILSGTFIRARVTGSNAYDLLGEEVPYESAE
jgi:ribosomal protein S12 methylthiotransferase